MMNCLAQITLPHEHTNKSPSGASVFSITDLYRTVYLFVYSLTIKQLYCH